MSKTIVVTRCPACDGTNNVVVTDMNDRARTKFLEFSRVKYQGFMNDWVDTLRLTIVRCTYCRHYWYREQPEPEQIDRMYTAAVPLIKGANLSNREPTTRMLSEMGALRRLVHAGDKKESTLLDFGSGYGRWARAAVKKGFKVTAYEPSKHRGAEENTPFQLVHELNTIEGQKFDVINVEQVLEHVPRPIEILRQIKSFCHSDTVIRLTVPNIDRSYEGKKIWETWPFDGWRTHTMAPFEHLHGFTAISLQHLASRAGYKPVMKPRLLLTHPVSILRQFLGQILPRVGHTFLLLQTTEDDIFG